MIEIIHIQLSIWGKWCLRQGTCSIGFPSVSPMFKDCASGRGYGSSVPIGVGLGSNEALRDIDRAVAQISQEQRALCAEFYIIGGKSEAIAARMGVSKKKLYANLDSTHSAVKMRLNNFATAW